MDNLTSNVTIRKPSCDFDGNLSHIFGLWLEIAITALYFVLGSCGRFIGLLAIYHDSKTEKAYIYQILLLGCECVETFAQSVVIALNILSGRTGYAKAVWFRRWYPIMWYTARLASLFLNTFMTGVAVLTLVVTGDRVFALIKPNTYRNMDQSKLQKISLAISVAISVGSSVVYCFLFDVSAQTFVDGAYTLVSTDLAVTNRAFSFFFNAQNVLKLALLVLLLSGNFVLSLAFRKAMKERAKLKKREDGWTSQWKTLFKMTLCQSICNTLGVAVNVAIKIYALFSGCYVWGFRIADEWRQRETKKGLDRSLAGVLPNKHHGIS